MNISNIGHNHHLAQIHKTDEQPKIAANFDIKHQENADKSISAEHSKGKLSKIDVEA